MLADKSLEEFVKSKNYSYFQTGASTAKITPRKTDTFENQPSLMQRWKEVRRNTETK